MTRFLLLGFGFWGRHWYEAIIRRRDCSIVAVAAAPSDLEALQRGTTLPPKCYSDYREAIDDADVDAAVIVLPTALHVDAGLRSLAKGLHILSEKPLASDLEGADRLRDEARSRPNQTYMVNQNYRWRGHNQALKRIIDSGEIGKPEGLHIQFRQPEFVVGDRASLEMPLIQDMSIHHFDLVRFLLGENAVELYARSFRPSWSKYTGSPATEAAIEMQSGLLVGYSGTWAARGAYTLWDGDITITGSEGCLKLNASEEVWCYPDTEKSNDGPLTEEPAKELAYVAEPIAEGQSDVDQSLDIFLRSVRTGVEAPTSLEDNYHSFAMVMAALTSARAGRPVKVGS